MTELRISFDNVLALDHKLRNNDQSVLLDFVDRRKEVYSNVMFVAGGIPRNQLESLTTGLLITGTLMEMQLRDEKRTLQISPDNVDTAFYSILEEDRSDFHKGSATVYRYNRVISQQPGLFALLAAFVKDSDELHYVSIGALIMMNIYTQALDLEAMTGNFDI